MPCPGAQPPGGGTRPAVSYPCPTADLLLAPLLLSDSPIVCVTAFSVGCFHGTSYPLDGPGRPCKMTPRAEHRAVQYMRKNPRSLWARIAEYFGCNEGQSCCSRRCRGVPCGCFQGGRGRFRPVEVRPRELLSTPAPRDGGLLLGGESAALIM